jgi:hypothetical protein
MNYLLIIYLVIGIIYLLQSQSILERYANNCQANFHCNSKLIAESINRIRKKYLNLENNLKQIKLI